MSEILLRTEEVERNPTLREKLLSRWFNPIPRTVQRTDNADKKEGEQPERFDR